jgi:hypothetical protein
LLIMPTSMLIYVHCTYMYVVVKQSRLLLLYDCNVSDLQFGCNDLVGELFVSDRGRGFRCVRHIV